MDRYAVGRVDAPPDISNRRVTMHYCPDCGTQVQEGARLCPTCGTNLMAYTQLSQTPLETIWDFLTIKRMYTPLLILLLFWLGTLAVVGFGITLFITGHALNVRLLGLIYLILGPVVIRVISELLMLVTRMDETLTQIKNNSQGRG